MPDIKSKYVYISVFELRAFAHAIKSGISPTLAIKHVFDGRFLKSERKHGDALTAVFNSGQSYSDMFLKTNMARNETYMDIIRISESSGLIAESIEGICVSIEETKKVLMQCLGAILYPAIIISISGIFIIFISVYIVPQIKDVLAMPGVDQNSVTKSLILISELIKSHLFTFIALCGASPIVFWGIVRIKRIRTFLEKCILKIPLFSTIITHYEFGVLAELISTYSRFRPDIQKVFNSRSRSTKLLSFSPMYDLLYTQISAGGSLSHELSEAKKTYKSIPEIWLLYAMIAEKALSYEKVFRDIRIYHHSYISHITKILLRILEPALMLIIGIIIGFLAYGIMGPMYSVMQGMSS